MDSDAVVQNQGLCQAEPGLRGSELTRAANERQRDLQKCGVLGGHPGDVVEFF